MPTTVSFRDLRQNLAAVLQQARQGAEIIVTSRGEEVARIVPPAKPPRRPVGLLKGKIHMAPDFDDTPEEVIAAMEGGEQ
jgi:prevent-host-death family protein